MADNALAPLDLGTAGGLLAAMHGNGPAGIEVPKPFSQRICLLPDARVAGSSHVKGIYELAEALRVGDELRLERDPQNRFDGWAIRVLDSRGHRLGFVPADKNEIIARLMDGGKRVVGEVLGVEDVSGWVRIGMAVWLDD